MSRSQVRTLLEAPDGSLAQMDKSTTIRMSLSGVLCEQSDQRSSANLSRVTFLFLDIVFNGSMQSLGVCGVSSLQSKAAKPSASLAIQTKVSFSSNKPGKETSFYTKFRIAMSLFSTFFRTFRVLAVSVFSLLPSRVIASFISLQSSADNGISVME